MIKQFGILVAAASLTACWGAPPDEKILAGLCTDLVTGDTRIVEDIAIEAGTDIDGFCGCYAKSILTDSAKTTLHKDVINAMVEARKESDRGVEDAAQFVEGQIESGEIDTFTAEQLDSTGDDFQRISSDMRDNEGVCPI